jgi:CubicO group peptidase (beta-lactamase class C family)
MNDMKAPSASAAFPLAAATPAELGFHEPALQRLRKLIRSHIESNRYPGAQIALARHGKLALFETFGHAKLGPDQAASNDTLWLLYSNTKVITAVGMWMLVEDGLLRFSDAVAEYVPEFAQHGKGGVTIAQVMSHRGGFPSQECSANCWVDHAELRRQVCNFTLEWTIAISSARASSNPSDWGVIFTSVCPMRSTLERSTCTSPPMAVARSPGTRRTRRSIAVPAFRAAGDSPRRAAWPPSTR